MNRVPALPERTKGVRRNAQWLLLGNAVYALGYWLQFMILARTGGAAAVGSYAYALALTTPPIGFASLQLRGLLATDANGAYAFREYLALRTAAIAAALMAILVIALTSARTPGVLPVIIPVCLMRTADALSDIYYGWWQRRERMALIGLGVAISGTASVLLMGVAALLGGSVSFAASGAALGSCGALAFVHFRTTAAERALPDPKPPAPFSSFSCRRLLRLAAEAAPLGVITLLGSLQTNVPLYFVRLGAGAATPRSGSSPPRTNFQLPVESSSERSAPLPSRGSQRCTRAATRAPSAPWPESSSSLQHCSGSSALSLRRLSGAAC